MLGSGANEAQLVSLDDALMLVEEVQRLRAELAKCEARIQELDRLAHWDVLVDLPNRRRFVVSLERAIAKIDRYGGDAAVLFLDVDGLKRVNDKHGHNAGDKVLAQVASLLASSVRQADLVARLAGDEFAVLLENTDEFQAWEMALRIIEAVDECEFSLDGVPMPLSVAAGVAPIRAGDIAETVLSRADEAMYRIKASCPLP